MRFFRLTPFACTVVAVASLSGCGSDDTGSTSAEGRTILTGFYPLQYVTARIAGDRAEVRSLTPPGVEPHDLELTPKDVAAVADAGLVVHLAGFQPALDEAATTEAGGRSLDVTAAAVLDLEGHEEHEEGEEEHAEEEGTGRDPHFWLDPTKLAAVAGAIAERLRADDPGGAAAYDANLATLQTELAELDAELRAGLASCTSKSLVTSHEAFGYLARRYGMTQVGIAGLSAEAEPDAATVARVTGFARANRVRTIYYETLVSPAVARTVAEETGAATAVLDPIEGLAAGATGSDYLSVMRANLATLRAGQPCP